MRTTLSFAMVVGLLLSCGQKQAAGHGSHDYKPLHKGQMIHLADHGPILEIVYDQQGGAAKMYVFDAHQKQKSIDKAPALVIPTHDDPITATGKGDVWNFSHPALTGHVHGMRIRITVDGKQYNLDWHPVHE